MATATAATEITAPAAAAAPTPAATPVAAASSAAPVIPPAVEPAPAAATPEAKTPESTPSLLATADAGKREGAPKPADTPPPDGAKKDEPAPAAEAKPPEAKPAEGAAKPEGEPAAATEEALAEKPPALPTYDAFKVPEGQKLSDKELGQFTEILGKFESEAKIDHAKAQALGQQLIDFYIGDVQRVGTEIQTRMEANQREVWARYNETEIGRLKADPELGGTRIDEKLGNAKYVIEQFLPKADQDSLLTKFDNGGVANSVELIRMLNNIYERYREPGPIAANPNNAAIPAARNEPGQRGWYRNVDGQGQAA